MKKDYAQIEAECGRIIADIARRTGLNFAQLESIDRNHESTIRAVLPIVREWVAVSQLPNVRRSIYIQFLTPYAADYVDDILAWVRTENEHIGQDILLQALYAMCNRKNAERIWNAVPLLPPNLYIDLLLAKLVRFSSVPDQIVDRIMSRLEALRPGIERGDPLPFAVLDAYSRLSQPRIQRWFRSFLNSSNKDLSRMARRSCGRAFKLPRACRIASQIDRDFKRTVISTEVDDSELGDFLRTWEKALEMKLPAGVRSARILDVIVEDRWTVCDIAKSSEGPIELWLRLEATKTIEVWIMRAVVSPVC